MTYVVSIIIITVIVVFIFSGKNKNTPWQTPEDENTMNDAGSDEE